MRKPVAALVLALRRRPRRRRAGRVRGRCRGEPKVVIIVGATHGATAELPHGRRRAYAEAIKYTSNVVKVYSPNATWAKVKAAAVGRVDRHLHGPRQRLAEPVHLRPEVHDQGRLRAQRDGRRRRLQQQVLRRAVRRDARPRAERGRPPPPPLLRVGQLRAGQRRRRRVTVARQRVDNYAAGFLKAGASAVIADGHAGAGRYLRALFTTHAVDRGPVARRSRTPTTT